MSEQDRAAPPLREVPCKTCARSGRVPKVLPPGVYGFSEWPTEACRTCHGPGWVLEAP